MRIIKNIPKKSNNLNLQTLLSSSNSPRPRGCGTVRESSVCKFKLLLFLSIIFLIHSTWANDFDVTRRNNEATDKFKQEKFLEAYETFMSLLAEEPQDPVILFNLGVSLEAVAEEDKAEKLYVELLKLLDIQMESAKEEEKPRLVSVYFATLYNLAGVYSRKKEIDKSLENYQKALKIVPDSKEIKTNIELMFQMQQGGGGEGDDESEGESGEGQGDDQQQGEQKQKKQQGQGKQDKDQQKKKQKFDQSQMSMEDLKRILEELKEQEEKIRAKFQSGGSKENKESANGKNW